MLPAKAATKVALLLLAALKSTTSRTLAVEVAAPDLLQRAQLEPADKSRKSFDIFSLLGKYLEAET